MLLLDDEFPILAILLADALSAVELNVEIILNRLARSSYELHEPFAWLVIACCLGAFIRWLHNSARSNVHLILASILLFHHRRLFFFELLAKVETFSLNFDKG